MSASSLRPKHNDRTGLPASSTAMSRRTFLAGAAASAIACPTLSTFGYSRNHPQALLHLADTSSGQHSVHTYLVTADRCGHLGSTRIDSLAAFAAHPALPVLYVARDCSQWQHLPRGVVETYAVQDSSRPLRLLAQTPMSLSATGPRALAVSNCGKYLVVSAATGGAWNAFTLASNGIPDSLAIARKETGRLLDSSSTSLPSPHAVVFSPRRPFAIGTDPSTRQMSLLAPSPNGIAVTARCRVSGLSSIPPAWMMDGNHIVVASPTAASLSLYAVREWTDGSDLQIQLVDIVQTETPVCASISHREKSAIFTARPQKEGTRIELWSLHRNRLSIENHTWLPGKIRLLVQDDTSLWLVAEDRLIQMRKQDLRNRDVSPLPFPASQSVITRIV